MNKRGRVQLQRWTRQHRFFVCNQGYIALLASRQPVLQRRTRGLWKSL
ncbi:hypothetical protein CPter91_5209 [Collimonas pratensis]|uniref:Uncharacterized protein n=1 Tax=Collimonas pratensis TaxID=279113 RepID=A0A127QBS9_9BURK|nr:hypothetical protein CPter91_5209 [Collimonas pratensis]